MLPASVASLVCRLLIVRYGGESPVNISPFPAGTCIFCCPVDFDRDVEYHLFTRRNPTISQVIEHKDAQSLKRSFFKPGNPTVMYIHGYTEQAGSVSGSTIRNAYLFRGDFNVILVNWCKLSASPWYVTAVKNTISVGRHVAHMARWLDAHNAVSLSRLHVIGFSLGAEVAGFMGKALGHRRKVGRITGLDAAYPLYMNTGAKGHLVKNDANFVDVIHTNGGIFGFPSSLGHADFFPNGGGPNQPGCDVDTLLTRGFNILINQYITCSHNRAWRFYAESITNPNGFLANHCLKWRRETRANCSGTPDAFMGFGADPEIRGKFYLRTNARPPYAKKNANRD